MEDKIQRLVNAANSTNAKAKEIGEKQLRELGLDNNGNPLKSASTKDVKPKAERKKRQPKSKAEPKPKYKVGDILNHSDSGETYKVKILAVTGWTGDGHRYDVEFLDENLKPKNKFAKSYDDKLSRITKGKSDQPYDCDDLIAKAEERKAKAKAAAAKRANEPKKTQATKNAEAIEKTAERVEKNVEKRVKKDNISFGEIKKLIAEYEDAIAKLKALLAKAEGKMAKGGGVNAEEVEHILMKAQGVKEHHCGCNDKKMAKGGGVGELSIHLISAEDDTEHLVYALFDNNNKIIKTDFEDVESAKMWAKENGYNAIQYAKGGGVRGGINRKYAYFAVDKKDNKIVDAWELVDDVESLKYYAKQDLIDNDRNPKHFSILSKKYLISQGIQPFEKSNWKN